MAKTVNIKDLRKLIQKARDAHITAYGRSLIRVLQRAELLAKRNVKSNFKGRNNYVLSGRLLNSIFTGYNINDKEIGGFVGSRGLPYARIHEYGGEIKPVKAKYLWIPTRKISSLKKMTPREFITAMNKAKSSSRTQRRGKGGPRSKGPTFSLIPTKKGGLKIAARVTRNGNKEEIEPVFFLVQKVKMPARPYLRPAAKEAAKEMPEILNKEIKKAIEKLKGKK